MHGGLSERGTPDAPPLATGVDFAAGPHTEPASFCSLMLLILFYLLLSRRHIRHASSHTQLLLSSPFRIILQYNIRALQLDCLSQPAPPALIVVSCPSPAVKQHPSMCTTYPAGWVKSIFRKKMGCMGQFEAPSVSAPCVSDKCSPWHRSLRPT